MREDSLSDKAMRKLVERSARNHRFARARLAAAKIVEPECRQSAVRDLLARQAVKGDLTGMKETAALVSWFWWGHWIDVVIQALVKAGEIELSLELANKLLPNDEECPLPQHYKALIVAQQAENGDIPGALQTLKKVSPLGRYLDEALEGITKAQAAAAGDQRGS